jgi:hypothetical protein
MKKFALSLVIAAVAIFGSGVAAQASTYPPGGTVVAPPEVLPGGSFTATITGCTPSEVMTFLFLGGSELGICELPQALMGRSAALTVGTGTASATFNAPTANGNYEVMVTGSLGFRGSVSVSVTSAVAPATPTAPSGGLPATGTDGIPTMTMMALGFFVVGGGLLTVSQMRRRQIVPA